jgi:hypothetical protein
MLSPFYSSFFFQINFRVVKFVDASMADSTTTPSVIRVGEPRVVGVSENTDLDGVEDCDRSSPVSSSVAAAAAAPSNTTAHARQHGLSCRETYGTEQRGESELFLHPSSLYSYVSASCVMATHNHPIDDQLRVNTAAGHDQQNSNTNANMGIHLGNNNNNNNIDLQAHLPLSGRSNGSEYVAAAAAAAAATKYNLMCFDSPSALDQVSDSYNPFAKLLLRPSPTFVFAFLIDPSCGV